MDKSKIALYGLAHLHRSTHFLNRATGEGPNAIQWTLDSPHAYGFVVRKNYSQDMASVSNTGDGHFSSIEPRMVKNIYFPAPTEQESVVVA